MKKNTSSYQAASGEKRAQLIERLLRFHPKFTPTSSQISFGDVFTVWADFAMEELKAKGGSLLNILSPGAQGNLKDGLMFLLSDRCAPNLNQLLLLAEQKNILAGETPKERAHFFIEKVVTHPEFLQGIFKSFPFLAKIVSTQILLWIDQALLFISRLNTDMRELETVFSVRGKVTVLSPPLSTFHNGNKTVYQLIFENNISVIYKPKSLKIDAAYNQFLSKLNQLDIEPKLKTYRFLLRDQYGWVEFVRTLPCQTEEEVKQFFQKFGMLICLVFLLDGTDCGNDNVIASGADPVLIDVESLFQPIFKYTRATSQPASWDLSVFRTGFLPITGLFLHKQEDRSPLSVSEEQEMPTNPSQTVKVRVPRPKLHGETVATTNYVADLLAGFEKMYLLFARNKNQIVPWVNDLSQYPVRCIFRPTSFYFHLLEMLIRSRLSRLESEAEMPMELLIRFFPIQNDPHLKAITEYEKEALLHGDFPYFLSFPINCHLHTEKELLAPDLFKEPVKTKVLERIQNLNEKEMRQQLEYIDHSLYFLKFTDKKITYKYKPPTTDNLLTENELLHTAEKIGHQILALAEPFPDGTNGWISFEFDFQANRYVFYPLSPNLHSGEAGIALFFASLGKAIKNPMFIGEAEKILQRLKKPFYEDKENALLLTLLGGMMGLGSLIYTYAAIGKILGKSEYLKDAAYFASLIEKKKIDQDIHFDLVQGSAGLILSLLSLYEKTEEKSLLEKAKEAGDHLLLHFPWSTFKDQRLCGLSRGTAGIAYALSKLGAQVNDPSFLKAAEKALELDSPESGQYSWCHGAPGIALARLYTQRDEGIQKALAVIQNHLVGDVDHLCCGTFGRLAILWDAAHILKQNDLKKIVFNQTAALLNQYAKTSTFKLLPNEKAQSPGFMQGLSGIGYFLLRLTKAGKDLPEVLILE